MDIVRAPWTSVSFLHYAGGLTILAAAIWLLVELSGDYSDASFTGWALLVFALAAVCAFAFRQAGRALAAGVLAVVMVVCFAVFVGALEEWFGWLPDNTEDASFEGFRWGLILLELATLVFSSWALATFRFPLLVLATVAVGWFFFTDVLSGGGDWSATVTIAFGLIILLAAVAANDIYGFWLHVAAGLTIGGGLLWFWNSSDLDWILVALVALLYIWLGGAIERSSWVVLGAFGLFLSATHFVDKWFDFELNPIVYLFGGQPASEHPWARPLWYVGLGFVYLLLAFLLQRRRRALPPPAPETPPAAP